ncbi:hypothetical protein D1AOALGA4SA_4290 [Olavius algarvensis Delta 1 endosymbiont]|nr:hypothetical protein D1AOALGA4SA_4290 [Olavius algarvensis Delta 1 endosymbiont]
MCQLAPCSFRFSLSGGGIADCGLRIADCRATRRGQMAEERGQKTDRIS